MLTELFFFSSRLQGEREDVGLENERDTKWRKLRPKLANVVAIEDW